MHKTMPRTYIRMDVAHYIKTWANFLKSEKSSVKKFYLFAIGQLIICDYQQQAGKIIKALFIISLSPTSGNGATSLKDALQVINDLVQGQSSASSTIREIVESTLNMQDIEEMNDIESQKAHVPKGSILKKWGDEIKREVDMILATEKGDDINPRECQKFAKRLQKHILTIPLWSSICRHKFGYGRIPASSAPVESEFKTAKGLILMDVRRLDVAVEKLVNYNSGKLKIIECREKFKTTAHTTDNRQKKSPPVTSVKIPEKTFDEMDISTEESLNQTCNQSEEISLASKESPTTFPTNIATNNNTIDTADVIDISTDKSLTTPTTKIGIKRKEIDITNAITLNTDESFATPTTEIGRKGKRIDISNTITSSTDESLITSTGNSESFKVLLSPHESAVLRSSSTMKRSPLKDLMNITHSGASSTCDQCEAGKYPGEDLKCSLCNQNVHDLPGCSTMSDEDGQRICWCCFDSSTKDIRFAYNEKENWRNLGTKKQKKRRNRYLGDNNQNLIDVVTSSKLRVLPILPNGNGTLGFIHVGQLLVSFKHTCAFDSIFQILLAGVTDNDVLRKYVQDKKNKNRLFEMVLHVFESSITQQTYKQRGELLVAYNNALYRTELDSETILEIDCKCNVRHLANFLFKNTPSFIATATCPFGCTPRIQASPTITIVGRDLQKPLAKVIKDHVVLPGVPCVQKQCKKSSKKREKNELHAIGNTYGNILR